MKAKLIKREDGLYSLYDENGKIIYGKLSLKNCQAIENGYDLDELAKNYSGKGLFEDGYDGLIHPHTKILIELAYIKGFQKALELNNTKLYTLEDMMNCWNKALTFQNHKETLGEYIQSLQQTEWDVEICCYIGNGDKESDSFKDPIVTNTGIPKLDADGCLILRRMFPDSSN